jgi:hypothetical protein
VARGSDSRIRFARENLGRVIARRAVRATSARGRRGDD